MPPLEALEAEIQRLRDRVRELERDLALERASHLFVTESSARLDDLTASLEEERRLSRSLAGANAQAAELMASLEEALDEQRAMARRLAEANAHAAELMAQLEEAREYERRQQARALEVELQAAVAYVRSLLPSPLRGDVSADWRFLPSADLGGDVFGYHWVDDQKFAFYLLDVCGHGIAATLLATSVLTVLRGQRLDVDFRDPGAVLGSLNREFPIDQHGRYFTAWYGVYDRKTRELLYASGGHPPALLVGGTGAVELGNVNPMVGIVSDATFRSSRTVVRADESIFVFSDGVYEVARPDGKMLSFDEFTTSVVAASRTRSPLDACVDFARAAHGSGDLDDDYSLLQVSFA